MPIDRSLPYGGPLPATWLSAIQQFIGQMTANFQLSLASHNSIQVVADAASNQVSIGINGLFRYNSATITAAVTGSAGVYSIFATCGPNSFTPGVGGAGETDATNYAFALSVLPTGTSPTVNGTTLTAYRQVGELDFDGTNITHVRQLYGASDTTMPLMPRPDSTTEIALRVAGLASQSAALQTWENSAGTVLAKIMAVALGATDSSTNVATTQWVMANTGVHQPGDLIFSAASTRSGALLCDGSAVSRTTFAALFTAIGTTYGAGDGSTTFNVPNYLGRVVVGAGTGAGLTARARGSVGGEEGHLLISSEGSTNGNGTTNNENVNHVHGGGGAGGFIVDSFPGSETAFIKQVSAGIAGDTGVQLASTTATESAFHFHTFAARNADSAHNTMQPFGVSNIFIKT